MIRFEHVSKAYLGGRQALQGVTFHMQPGEMAFLTGHSGAGKSTLLKLICGIERPSAGKIFFSGHDITRLKKPRSAVFAPPDWDDFPGSPSADGSHGL